MNRKRAYELSISEWSSDVCSADLAEVQRQRLSLVLQQQTGMRAHELLQGRAQRRQQRTAMAAVEHGIGTATLQAVDAGAGQPQRRKERIDVRGGEIGRASCRERVCQYV